MRWFFSRYTLNDLVLFQKSHAIPLDVASSRQRVRIAVIDDQPFPHLDNLRDSHFDISQVGNISNVTHVEKYDVVACDLRGVGKAISEKNQGAAIIEEIKRLYPDKFVIAYSGSFARSTMVDIALNKSDDNISKAADLDKWFVLLDNAIQQVADPVERWKRIKSRVADKTITADELAAAEDAYVKSIIKGKRSILERHIKGPKIGDDLRIIIRSLVTSAVWAAVTAA